MAQITEGHEVSFVALRSTVRVQCVLQVSVSKTRKLVIRLGHAL
jgi:hypothetical protein